MLGDDSGCLETVAKTNARDTKGGENNIYKDRPGQAKMREVCWRLIRGRGRVPCLWF